MPPLLLDYNNILTHNPFRPKLKAAAKVAKFAQKRHFCQCEFVRNSSRQNSPPKKLNVKKVLHPDGRVKMYLCVKSPCAHRSAIRLVGSVL